MIKKILILTTILWSAAAFAEIDPALEDVSVEKLNPGGIFVKGVIDFGQSDPAGKSSGGTAYAVGGEFGYAFASSYWKRFEGGIQITTGQHEYTTKNQDVNAKVTLEVPMQIMLKTSIGKSMGGGMMMMYSLGVGTSMVKYKAKAAGTSYTADSVSAFTWRIGASFLMPFTETFSFDGGVQFSQMTVNVDELKTGGTTVPAADISDIVNTPAVSLGFRLTI